MCMARAFCTENSKTANTSPVLSSVLLLPPLQILLALQYVHGKSILHRDLKTANIFLTKEVSTGAGGWGGAGLQLRHHSLLPPSHPHEGKDQLQRSSFNTGPAVPLSHAPWPQGTIKLNVAPLQRIANPIHHPWLRVLAAPHTLQEPTHTLPCHPFLRLVLTGDHRTG